MPLVPELLGGAERERLRDAGRASSPALGAPADLARGPPRCSTPSRCSTSSRSPTAEKRPADEVAAIYFALSERFEVDRMLTRITGLPRDDRWSALARTALRYDLYAALAGLTAERAHVDVVRRSRAGRADRGVGGAELRGRRPGAGDPRRDRSLDSFDLATLSVALRTIRTLLRN